MEFHSSSRKYLDRYQSSNIEFIEIKKEKEKELDWDFKVKSPTLNMKNNLNKNTKTDLIIKIKSEPLSLNKNNIINEVEEKSSLSWFDGEMIIGNGAMPDVSEIEDKSSGSLNITDEEIKKDIDNFQEMVPEEKENKDKKNIVNISPKKEIKNDENKSNNIKNEEKKKI